MTEIASYSLVSVLEGLSLLRDRLNISVKGNQSGGLDSLDRDTVSSIYACTAILKGKIENNAYLESGFVVLLLERGGSFPYT